MGTKKGPNYANFFGGPLPDDCLATASCSHVNLEEFISFADEYHPALQFTLEISETSVTFSLFLFLRRLCSEAVS